LPLKQALIASKRKVRHLITATFPLFGTISLISGGVLGKSVKGQKIQLPQKMIKKKIAELPPRL